VATAMADAACPVPMKVGQFKEERAAPATPSYRRVPAHGHAEYMGFLAVQAGTGTRWGAWSLGVRC
jgi:hypothetical protein